MKYKKYIFVFCLAAIGLCSCSEDETPLFDTSYSALNVWFGTTGSVLDSINYNYSYTLGAKDLMFQARILGSVSNVDRTFTIEAFSGDLTEAKGSFSTDTYTIKAGESSAEFPIHFDTSKLSNSASFTTKDGHLWFRLVENASFVKGAESMQILKVVLKNYLSKPTEWDAAIYPLRAYSLYFGKYSKVKYQFMIQELGLVDFHISYTAIKPYDEATNTLSANYASYLVQCMQLALSNYNSSHTTPLTDETGAAVTF
ncbi:MAG: DUF4843 domain-containing protein [Bacteroidales bacterium]|nr:DUF4843 domain-containing protein [Bacteroidales bacterium]